MRWLARLPIWLYRAHLGWLLGNRFLMLTQIGRRSGLPRRVVLEVVHYEKTTNTWIVAAAWGAKADWFRNIQKTPHVVVDVGRKHFDAASTRLTENEAEVILLDYARQHPVAFRELARLMLGRSFRNMGEDCHTLAHSVPLVALRA